jgi:hypothetical protein
VYTGKKWWFTPVPHGKQGARLPEKFRGIFEKKQVVCVEYDDIRGDEEREIFKVMAFPIFPECNLYRKRGTKS